MSTYCIYLTIYLGDKLPPFYIGSTSIEKVKKGYCGSVTSVKYKHIWKSELKHNRHLFKTYIIPTVTIRDMTHKLELEAQWQRAFGVVHSDIFTNQCIATQNLFATSPETIIKAKETRAKTFKSRNIIGKMAAWRHGIRMWNNGINNTWSHNCPGEGWVLGATDECKQTNSKGQLKRPPYSTATREKHRQNNLGSKRTVETVEKIRQARLGTKRSPETCNKISAKKMGQSPWNKGKQTGQLTHNAQRVMIISPTGEIFEHSSMRQACITHNLSTASMCNVKQGKQDNYKGWRVIT
jgi:hypothetical protein